LLASSEEQITVSSKNSIMANDSAYYLEPMWQGLKKNVYFLPDNIEQEASECFVFQKLKDINRIS